MKLESTGRLQSIAQPISNTSRMSGYAVSSRAQQSGTYAAACRSDSHSLLAGIYCGGQRRISSLCPRSYGAMPTGTVAVSATQVPQLDVVGKPCAVLWDLDNVCPRNARVHLVPAIQQLQTLLLTFGVQDPVVTCYANVQTCSMLGDEVLQQLRDTGILVQQVQARQQAADVLLSSDACAYSQQHADKGCLVCVTHDKGFGPMLAYCTGVGVTTILVTALPSPKYMPGLLPDLAKHRMASACTATLPWQHNKNLAAAKNSSTLTQRQHFVSATSPPWSGPEKPQQQAEFVNATGNRQPRNTLAGSDGGAEPVNSDDDGCRIPRTRNSGNWHRLSNMGSPIEYIEPWLYLNPLYAKTTRA